MKPFAEEIESSLANTMKQMLSEGSIESGEQGIRHLHRLSNPMHPIRTYTDKGNGSFSHKEGHHVQLGGSNNDVNFPWKHKDLANGKTTEGNGHASLYNHLAKAHGIKKVSESAEAEPKNPAVHELLTGHGWNHTQNKPTASVYGKNKVLSHYTHPKQAGRVTVDSAGKWEHHANTEGGLGNSTSGSGTGGLKKSLNS